mmetsp:Transcript_68480/g.200314  ORF Transcript_68480/g.200314 Transcript_68480/m.200314 type:complete len:146 (+) Transcript_68480:94-531(+)
MEVRPGDWECPKCGDNQFARNMECRKCGEPKPRDLDNDRGRRDDFGGPRSFPKDADGREFCADFKRGNCFREYCRFSHGGASQERERGGDRGRGGDGRDDRGRGGYEDRGSGRDRDRRDRSRDRRRRDDSRRRRDSRSRDRRRRY